MRLPPSAAMLFALAAPALGAPSLFLSVLPPGQDGLVPVSRSTPGLHATDQVRMYADLILAAPGIRAAELRRFFKDAGINAPPAPERIERPRAGVTIARDAFGVPHVRGETRGDVFFGAGYVTAEDRLFLTDAFRHVGRGRLSEFLGPVLGLDATVGMDRGIYAVAGYSEEELQAQIDAVSDAELMNDITEFTAGINAYIAEARSDPAKMPLEYSLLDSPPPADWQVRDVVAIAVLFNSTFGFGGGGEHRNVILQQALAARHGAAVGRALWDDLREADDPEAPVTTLRRFPYLTPGRIDPAAVAIPDAGSITGEDPIAVLARVRTALGWPRGMSNFMAVTARKAAGGHPIAVMGPQTGYRSPELLIEYALRGGGVDVRGATFPGVPYVTLGHTPHYAWSATSGGSDLGDVRVERLCTPPGGEAESGVVFRGACRPITRRVDSWTAAGQTITATVERTPHGNVFARATVNGERVALAIERSTFFHEIESAPAFALLDTDRARGPRAFRHALSFMNSSFNWLYVDAANVAYFHSGRYPRRAPGVDPDLPSWGTGEWEWEGLLPTSKHPFDLNPRQGFVTSWNNKPARAWRAADANYAYGPVYRSLALDVRLARAVERSPVEVTDVVDVMADAATVDLRGQMVAPDALALAKGADDLHGVVRLLRRWVGAGAHRRDRDGDGHYDDDAAVALMDAWYPRLLHAALDDLLGTVYDLVPVGFDDAPSARHLGSAYQDGYYGYLCKVFRRALGRLVASPYRVLRCADGSRTGCAEAVRASLRAAVAELTARFRSSDPADWHADARADDIHYDLGGIVTAPNMPWQNRPTFQQVVQVR